MAQGNWSARTPHIGTYATYASLPAASSVPAGATAYTSDYGQVVSDGQRWRAPRREAAVGGDVSVWDDGSGGDRALTGAITASGYAWSITGAGAATASYTDGRIVSPNGTLYAYVDAGSALPRVDMAFSMVLGAGTNDPTTAMLVLLVDNAIAGLSTMLHLLVAPTGWTLQKRISGGSLTDVTSGAHVLLPSVRYAIGIEKLTSTSVRLHLPDGSTADATDAEFSSLTWRYPGFEINPTTNALVGRIESVSVGHPRRGGISAIAGAADMAAVAFLQGKRLTQRQRIEFTTAGGAGWYRIAQRSGWTTYEMAGRVLISARDAAGRSQYSEARIRTLYNTSGLTAGTAITDHVQEIFSHAYPGGGGSGNSPLYRIRLSTDSGGFNCYLDIEQGNADAVTAIVDFEGLFTPNPSPAVGATAGGTSNVIRAWSN